MKFKALVVLVLAASIGCPAVVAAQSVKSFEPQKRVLGYQDPETGQFHPLVHEVTDTTTAPSTGTVKLTLTISIKSTFPTTAKPTYVCGAQMTELSLNLSTGTIPAQYEEDAYSDATVSGTTATCTVTIPYSWVMPAASSTVETSVTGSYSVTVINNDGTITATPLRFTSGDFLVLTAVPPAGTTTTVAKSVTL